ncbi:hypothetical protein OG455_03595 [Kitasatospora sp. NBC_01287]|uniref:NAD(P)-dependent oxidoreductase n=1 Tax=Kitasatospora sp. NBC_01287 TaxID=2903573 RepID=UPI00225BB343|nr:NAD(P)-dependent oxidoreductase [Kitasatospora sp. NBC_01287]MCX4744613.1 hypothetical protein [Kitasatospora sp. NBC_01287]
MNAPRRDPEILITGTDLVPDSVVDYVRARGYTPRRVRRDDLSEDELIAVLDGALGYLLGGWETPTDRVFETVRGLAAIGFVGTDYQLYVPGWRRARQLGMAVVSAPGANAVSVAEYTLLLMLGLARGRTGAVGPARTTAVGAPPLGRALRGRRLGVIGLGRIGAEVARIAGQGFGMEVRYSAPRPNPATARALGLRRCPKPELLGWSDIVSLHRPGPATGEAPELGAEEFTAMRPGTLVIDTVHPALVDFAALLEAIEHRQVRCAFDGQGEGPAWDALTARGSHGLIAGPTAGYHTLEANEAASRTAARAVCDLLDAQRHAPLLGTVDDESDQDGAR